MTNVDTPDEAEFIIQYKMTERREPGYPVPFSTEVGQIDAVLLINGRKTIAWSESARSPLVSGKHPAKELMKRFLKELSKK